MSEPVDNPHDRACCDADLLEQPCLTCGCRIRPSGHPGNMCRTIAALRAERDDLRVQADTYLDERDESDTECDRLRATLRAIIGMANSREHAKPIAQLARMALTDKETTDAND